MGQGDGRFVSLLFFHLASFLFFLFFLLFFLCLFLFFLLFVNCNEEGDVLRNVSFILTNDGTPMPSRAMQKFLRSIGTTKPERNYEQLCPLSGTPKVPPLQTHQFITSLSHPLTPHPHSFLILGPSLPSLPYSRPLTPTPPQIMTN